jgi:site-specific recombinase XerD
MVWSVVGRGCGRAPEAARWPVTRHGRHPDILHVRGRFGGPYTGRRPLTLFTFSGHGRDRREPAHPLLRAAPTRREPLRADHRHLPGRPAPGRRLPARHGTTLAAATRADLEAFLAELLTRRSSSTAATYYKPLKLLYAWLVEEEEIPADPMRRMKRPMVPDKPVPIVPADGLNQLFRACAGNTFEARRDTALLMLLLDTGARRDEMAGSSSATSTWSWMSCWCSARAAASAPLPYGRMAGEALDRYLRARGRHKDAELPWLWLGKRGRLTEWGLVMMLRRRGAQAGLPGLHPHQFRHTFAHQWLAQGGTETDLLRIAGGSRVPCANGTGRPRPMLVPARRTGVCHPLISSEGDRLRASKGWPTAMRTSVFPSRPRPSGAKLGVLRERGRVERSPAALSTA